MQSASSRVWARIAVSIYYDSKHYTMNASMYVCMYVCIWLYIYICTCMYVYGCMYVCTVSHEVALACGPLHTDEQVLDVRLEKQLCADTGCSLEVMPNAIDDRGKWRGRVKEIHARSTTSRW